MEEEKKGESMEASYLVGAMESTEFGCELIDERIDGYQCDTGGRPRAGLVLLIEKLESVPLVLCVSVYFL